ncbi:MAG: hypothetical protein ACYDDU_21370 [Dermatophilaceae bacterium]
MPAIVTRMPSMRKGAPTVQCCDPASVALTITDPGFTGHCPSTMWTWAQTPSR